MRSNRISLTLFALLCGIITFIACSKYKDSDLPAAGLPEDKIVTASIQGRVLDENGVPVAGAVVSGGGRDTVTDVNGVFNFTSIKVSSRFGYVKVVKPGYFTGSRSVMTGDGGGASYVTISLIPRTSKGSFAAGSGGKVVVGAGDTVAFDAAAVVTASDGAAYSGTVHVYAAYLDPTDKNLSAIMPGDLRGIGADGKETALQSFGMMVVELEGDGGEKLQLAAGKPASITMAIPEALHGAAPDTIPMWYFSDTTGQWREQGRAVRKDGSYCGTTSHFTFWNCDVPAGVVNFKAVLKDGQGKPLVHTRVSLSSTVYGTTNDYSDSAGHISGLIPKGQALTFQVLNPCGWVVFGSNIGPALTDQDLGTLTIDMNLTELTLSGSVVDCNDASVASGYVDVLLDGQHFRGAVKDGSFEIRISRCSGGDAEAQLLAVDDGGQQVGKAVSAAVKSGSKDVGQLSACGLTIDQFIQINIDGLSFSFSAPPDNIGYNISSDYSYITGATGGSTKDNIRFYIYPSLTGTGPAEINQFNLNASSGRKYINWGTINCNIDAFGPVNGYIMGTISGEVTDSTTWKISPITGSLKVKRTY